MTNTRFMQWNGNYMLVSRDFLWYCYGENIWFCVIWKHTQQENYPISLEDSLVDELCYVKFN